ncbi:MAG: glycosyltransferase [Methylacidiphilales bacterium]|nr:glycosyltransferase [Candidatus Methylacidiphilales bacterium]
MKRLTIFRPPQSLRSGDDILAPLTAALLSQNGVRTEIHELWSEWWVRQLWFSHIPGRRTLFRFGPAHISLQTKKKIVAESNAIWLNGPSKPNDLNCDFEKWILKAGKFYIFHIQDDWFSIPGLKECASVRVRVASQIIVPTPGLKERILDLFPSSNVLVLEEPVDINRLYSDKYPLSQKIPVIIWSGSPYNLQEIPGFSEILQSVYKEHPFIFRVISGSKRPLFDLDIPWEWHPYDTLKENSLMSGASIALAPLTDSPYSRCKGCYKIKTYLAAGIPVIASAVGYQKELVQHGKTGFLANNANDWKEYFLELLGNYELSVRMGITARNVAVDKFSHKALIPLWAEALKKIGG